MNQRAARSRPSLLGGLSGGKSAWPRYVHPPRLVLSIALSLLRERERSFCSDAKALIDGVVPEPRVENSHLIPQEGPFLIATNHYYRRGYRAWWGIALITEAVASSRSSTSEITWVITDRWTYPDALRVRVVTPLTHLILTRLAHTYGFVSMPPMPPQPRYREQGACGVRQVLSVLRPSRDGDAPIIGIAPEGRDSSDGSLIAPPSGTGRFLVHMASWGLHILPVGVAEVDGVLTASFGPPFALEGWSEVDKRERDLRASTQVMAAIGAQLPPSLWGEYREEVERILRGGGLYSEGSE
ncbi:MAG TPA: hypothetical protein VMY98_05980 [Anaerolineae bacterium]|nr:hypothetical protein [Anaerolineae bacterium]